MPLFDPESARTLVGNLADSEHTLDLRGVSLHDAKWAISDTLQQRRSEDSIRVVVLIDPATPTSGETHFIPIGRQLLQARKQGLISRLHPLPEADGGGFYIELPGRA